LPQSADQTQTGSPLTLTPVSGALGEARDGGDQDRAEHKAYDPDRGKDKALKKIKL
jgi:hypothetical protein